MSLSFARSGLPGGTHPSKIPAPLGDPAVAAQSGYGEMSGGAGWDLRPTVAAHDRGGLVLTLNRIGSRNNPVCVAERAPTSAKGAATEVVVWFRLVTTVP